MIGRRLSKMKRPCRRGRSGLVDILHIGRRGEVLDSPYFGHGELTQRIYDALRKHGEAASADIATKAMYDKGCSGVLAVGGRAIIPQNDVGLSVEP